MAKKYLIDFIQEELTKKADIMCNKYCKYGDEVAEEQRDVNTKMEAWKKYCLHCPLNEFFR